MSLGLGRSTDSQAHSTSSSLGSTPQVSFLPLAKPNSISIISKHIPNAGPTERAVTSALQHVEEAFQHTVRRAQTSSEAGDGTLRSHKALKEV